MKKITSLLLSITILFSITVGLNLSVYAKVCGDFSYALLNDGTAEITDYSGTDKSLLIPSTIKGYAVTSIKEWCFSNSKLTKVTIPDSVTKIGDYAFYNSGLLKEVTFGSSLKTIGESAFKSCISIENLVLPNKVTTIGVSAFDGCRNIETIKIGSSLKTISKLNDGFATLPHGMMQNYKLKSITVNKNNKYFSSVDGVLFNKDKSKLLLYPDNKSTTTYYIPTTVKKIEKNAFINTTKLSNVIIPKSVENIDNAFFMTTLNSITILNMDCKIGTSNYFDGEGETKTVFKGLKNSTTETYAKSINCKFTQVIDAYSFKMSLSKTKYVYNGKVKTPTVTVKDRTGKKLVKNTDYTVSYASGRKNVGKYKVTVRFKGKYSGTKTLYFTIKPKATGISSISARSKGFTVKWYKRTTQTTGYQVQYSTSSKFTSPKTITISKTGTTSKIVKKLKAKKRYYVRVRTYKTVNGTRYYSSWSKAKYVTTKA